MSYIQCLAATGCKGDRGCRRGEPPGWQGRCSCQECSTRRPGSHIHGMIATSHFDISGSHLSFHSPKAQWLLCAAAVLVVVLVLKSCHHKCQLLLGSTNYQTSCRERLLVACGNAAATSQCILTSNTVTNSFPDSVMQHACMADLHSWLHHVCCRRWVK